MVLKRDLEIGSASMIKLSSVCKIFERGGGQKIENNEDQKKISPLRISPFFCPKLGEDQKKRFSLKISPVFGPKLREDQRYKIKK